MSELIVTETMFYDPFAGAGEEYFDPATAHQSMWERYAAKEVEHDYTADKFVADTEALMLNAQFAGQFDQAQIIVQRMHQLCGEDHGLRQSVEAREGLSSLMSGHIDHGHDHKDPLSGDKKDDKKDKKSKKKKKLRKGWLSLSKD